MSNQRTKRRFLKKSSHKVAQPPGTVSYVGDREWHESSLSIVDFDVDNFSEQKIEEIERCREYTSKQTTTWLNVEGVNQTEFIEKFGKHFNLHPLILEDVVHTDQRPKFEEYDDSIFIILKILHLDSEKHTIEHEQVSLYLTANMLITFQESNRDVFAPIKERIKQKIWRKKQLGADYLMYLLMDLVIDQYYIVLEALGEKIEGLDEALESSIDGKLQNRIRGLKRELVFIRKVIWPLRELIGSLQRSSSKLISKSTKLYFRDLHDNSVQMLEVVESYRDILQGVTDSYFTIVSNRMNDVMKVLTIIATLFIPPTFIAGVYGMNFRNMPELNTAYGYFVVVAVMIISIMSMLGYFKRKGWF